MEALYRREYLREDAETALDEAGRFGRDLREDAPDMAAFIRAYEPRHRSAPNDAARAGQP
jgi:hypothetical protein